MTLSNLPTETVISILFESIPESFESLALTCKRFYAVSTLYIADYNILRNKYRRLVLNDLQDQPEFTLDLFLDIAHSPVTARYVKYIDLRTVTDHARYLPRQIIGTREADLKDGIVSALIKQSGCIGQQNESLWARQISQEQNHATTQNGHYTIITLLSLLPNLSHLTLPRKWSMDITHARDLSDALVTVVQNANNESMPYAGLSNLTALSSCHEINYNTHVQFCRYSPFLAINSVREFYCTSLSANADKDTKESEDKTLKSLFPNLSRNLERVELGGCCLDIDEFTEFLECAPPLKIFKYSFMVKEQKGSWSWHPAKYVSAIEAFQGENLEELSISVAGDGCREVKGTGVKSFKGFENLKTLELDLRVLLGRRYNDPNSYYPYPEDALAACSSEIPTLLELLPPSIETLHLMIDQVNGPLHMSRLVKDFQENHKDLLPNLSYVGIRCSLHNKQDRPSEADAKFMTEQNLIWVNPMLKSFGSVETNYSEDFELVYYDTEGYSEALFMRGLREMVGQYPR